MACSGCARRRKKIAAAYHAVKHGVVVAKQSYVRQTTGRPTGFKPTERPEDFDIEVIDIRQQVEQ